MFQIQEEAQKPTKTELGQKLALERIEKRVVGYKADLEREMQERKTKEPPVSPRVYKSTVARESL
jgi:hypothetical protein